jgi:K+-transporting ATPase ATPase C chain
MKENLRIAILFTLVTTVIFGVLYPLAVTGLGQLFFFSKANGQMMVRDGVAIGSHIIGQAFSSPGYFQSRPSAAGTGYDAGASSGSNLGPTNKTLIDRVNGDVAKRKLENPGAAVPVDLVTTSASGLDPDISPAAAAFQIPRVAKERGMRGADVEALVEKHTLARQFGILGEPRVNVLELNLDLDTVHPRR